MKVVYRTTLRISSVLLVAVILLLFVEAQAQTLPRPKHVVIVIEENHSYGQIIGSAKAPYMNSLAAQGASFSTFYALHHPSQPNYLELFSGSAQGVTDDHCLGTFAAPSLGGELIKKGFTFRGYSEGLPGSDPLKCKLGKYARKHCPWVDFSDVPAEANLPFSRFPTDFNDLPTVSFVIPNLDNDMHDGSIQQADLWLKNNLDAYVQWAKSNDSLLILTWDEDNKHSPHDTDPKKGQNRIPTILVGQMVKAGVVVSDRTYTHWDLLRTLEEMYGVSPPVGGSQTATSIRGIWK